MPNKPSLSGDYPDLLAGQDDPALRELVADLEVLHTSHPLPTRLTRPLESGQPFPYEQPTELTRPLPGTLGRSMPRRRVRWNALAALLIVLLFVGTAVGTWSLVRLQGEAGKTTHPLACRASSVPAFPLDSIHMMTATEGWALLWTQGNGIQNRLLHTSDGGCHWTYATPANFGTLVAVYYFSGTGAWIMTSNPTSSLASVQFLRTSDSGHRWQMTTVPATSSLSATDEIRGVSFINAQVGWLLSLSFAQGNSHASRMTLYHSLDGGLTWQEVTHHASTDPGKSGSLPLDLVANGLSFLDSSTGWIAGGVDAGVTGLWATHDGGLSWHWQQLPLPRNISSYVAGSVTYAPQFFSGRDGILTVSSWAPYGLATYITHDAGATWQETAFLPVATNFPPTMVVDISNPSPVPVFSSLDFGWFWTGTLFKPQNTLFVTRDGGLHWIRIASLPQNYDCHMSDFISPSVGWITCALNGLPAPELFQTRDGGKTWQHVAYTIN